MTYTLAMALHPKIEIKKDGVAEVAMTDARAALTSLIREVSWGQRPGAFTERGTRVAMVVPLDFYERAKAQADTSAQLRAVFEGDESVARTFQAHYSELYDAVMAD